MGADAILIGDKQRFAVEIGEFWGKTKDVRRVDLWAANRRLTCVDNHAYVGSYLHLVQRSIDGLRSGSPLAPPVEGLTPRQMYRQAQRRHSLTRWQVINWGETTDNVGKYVFRVGENLVMTFEFWCETHQPEEERGLIFVAELPEREFIGILERTLELLRADYPKYQQPSLQATRAEVADEPDVYGEELGQALQIIRGAGFPAEVLGVGKKRFVHAEQRGRAAELSMYNDEYFAEFYNTSEDDSQIGYWDERLESAVSKMVEWLSAAADGDAERNAG